jgi:serine/threonine-protein kinase HipA
MKIKTLNVGTPQGDAGVLTRESQYVFNYTTTERDRETSLLMPIRAQSYSKNVLPPVFSMNMPEGYLHYRIVQRLAKYGNVDDMRLLAITGQHQIGRLTFEIPGAPPARNQAEISLTQLLKEPATAALFEHLVETYLESGISGAQPKVMIPDADKLLWDRATAIQPNLIVKSCGDEYPHLSLNEFLCMDAARRAGLTVPNFWLSDDGHLFVMERFDLLDGERLGVEDMSVLTDTPREPTGNYKYTRSYEDVATIIRTFCGDNALESLNRFFEYFTLSVACRNGDGHLKNWSLLYPNPNSAEKPRLSPLYDVVTTSAYDDINQRTGAMQTDRTMALKLNRSKSYPTREALIEFGKVHCLVRHPEKIIDRIGEAMLASLRENRARVDAQFFARMQDEWNGGLMSISAPRIHVRGS